MLPIAPRDCAPRIIHQHTHVHHHVHRVRHVHHKPAVFGADGFDTVQRGRTKTRSSRQSSRLASPSPVPAGIKNKFHYFMRHYGWTALAWVSNAIIFILNRISFGFGFRVGYLPFFGDNRD